MRFQWSPAQPVPSCSHPQGVPCLQGNLRALNLNCTCMEALLSRSEDSRRGTLGSGEVALLVIDTEGHGECASSRFRLPFPACVCGERSRCRRARAWLCAHRLSLCARALADYQVLKQFPFHAARTSRVMYETTHMTTEEVIAAAELMQSFGYANLLGGLGKVPYVVWHHLTHNLSHRPDWVPPPLPVKRSAKRRSKKVSSNALNLLATMNESASTGLNLTSGSNSSTPTASTGRVGSRGGPSAGLRERAAQAAGLAAQVHQASRHVQRVRRDRAASTVAASASQTTEPCPRTPLDVCE